MTLNHVTLGYAVTFVKLLASVLSLIFLQETLIWNKIVLLASNLLNLSDLVEKILNLQKFSSIFLFLSELSLLNVYFQVNITKELDNFTEILISIVFY